MPATTETRLVLELDEELFSRYERQAKLEECTVEDVIKDRLRKCRDHTSPRSLYIDHESLQEIEDRLGGASCSTVLKLIAALRNQLSIRVGKTKIEIPSDVAERLETRLSDSPDGDTLESVILHGMREYVGLGS